MTEEYARELLRWVLQVIGYGLLFGLAVGCVVGYAVLRLAPDHGGVAVFVGFLATVLGTSGVLVNVDPPAPAGIGTGDAAGLD